MAIPDRPLRKSSGLDSLRAPEGPLGLWGNELAFAYEATTQCPRTGRKPLSAYVTARSALVAAPAAAAPPPPPARPWRGVCPKGGISHLRPF
jgi:hypothetical protein